MASVVFIGCREMGYVCLEMVANKYRKDLSHVITFDESVRSKIAGFKSFDELCFKHSIPLTKVVDINSEESLNILRENNPDLIIQVAWTQRFSPHLLKIPKAGCIGFHSSLLPSYQGGSPVNWGIINGEKKWGITMFYMNEELDTGNIINQIPFEITLHDTCKTVYDKATKMAKVMLDRHWQGLLEGKVVVKKQDLHSGSRCVRRRPQDGLIDWSKSAKELYDWIRALTHPYPGAFTYYKGRKMYIWEAKVLFLNFHNEDCPGKIIGEIFGTDHQADAGMAVTTKNEMLILAHIQFENSPPLKGEEINQELKKGDFLG